MTFLTSLLAIAGASALPDPNSYSAIGWLVVGLAALVGMGNQADAWLARHRSKPPAGELHIANSNLAERVERLETKDEHRARELSETCKALINEGDERRRALYQKLEELRKEVKTDLKGLEDMVHKIGSENQARVDGVHARINKVLEAVYARHAEDRS